MKSAIKPNPDLAARLREARTKANLSQTVASVRSGVSTVTLRTAELYGAATLRTLLALSRLYGISIDELRGRGSEDKAATP